MSERHFEIEASKDFMDYLQKEMLRIDFIDESVDLDDHGARDYIGTARIPLHPLIKHNSIDAEFAVKDENEQHCGRIKVMVAIHDAALTGYADGVSDEYSAKQTHNI